MASLEELLRRQNQLGAPTTAGALDWSTFQDYLTPALYGSSSFSSDNRGAYSRDLGQDFGGDSSFSIVGLDPGQYAEKVRDEGQGGAARTQATADNRAAVYDSAEWRAAVDAAMANADTIYQATGDRIAGEGEDPGRRARTTVQYKRVGDKLVPIGQKDFERTSSWNDFRDSGALAAIASLATMGAAGAGMFGSLGGAATPGMGIGEIGAASGAGGASNAALIESALGTAGYGTSSASGLGAALGGGGTLIAGNGTTFADLVNMGAIDPGVGSGDLLSGMDLAADAGVGGANSIGTAGAQFPGTLPIDPYDVRFSRPVGTGVGNLGNMGGGAAVLPSVNLGQGPLSSVTDWLGRLVSGDRSTLDQLRLIGGGLGLVDSLTTDPPRAPGPPPPSKYNDWTPAQKAVVDKFFQNPAKPFVYKPPKVFADVPARMNEGGPVRSEPRVGTKAPPRRGGGGGALSNEAIEAALLSQALREAAAKERSGIGALSADYLRNPRATNAERERRAGSYADGGGVIGMEDPTMGMAATSGDQYAGRPRYIEGEGGGQDDLVPINASPGEYVFDADVVAALGDGSNEEGARRLDEMREAIRRHKRGVPADRIPPKARAPLQYLTKE